MATTHKTTGAVDTREVHSITELGSTPVNISGASKVIHALSVDNSANAAAKTYLKIWNKSTPVVGTDVPDMVIPIGPGDVWHASLTLGGLRGIYTAALAVAAVTSAAVAGTTSPTSPFNVDITIDDP